MLGGSILQGIRLLAMKFIAENLGRWKADGIRKANVEASRRRIQRLSYVESVEIDTKRIPGVDDFVDLDVLLVRETCRELSM